MDDDLDGGHLPFGTARFGRIELSFYLTCSQWELAEGVSFVSDDRPTRPGDQEMAQRLQAKNALGVAEAIEAAVSSFSPGVEVRATAYLEGVPTGGPGVEGEILRFFVDGDPVGRVADVLGILAGIKLTRDWIRQRQIEPVKVSDGVAVLLAADAMEAVRGARDVTVHFVAPIGDFEDGYATIGYLVGFLHAGELVALVVSRDGVAGDPFDLVVPQQDQAGQHADAKG